MTGFLVLGGVALAAALLVVGARNPVLSALWLALNLAAVAGIFLILGAEFLAAMQLIIYAGAVLVFFLFVVMLLDLGQLPRGDPGSLQRSLGLFLSLVIAIVVGFAIHVTGGRFGAPGIASPEAVAKVGNTEAVAGLLYTRYLVAFELAGLLLTAAVVGAVVLARGQAGGAGREPERGEEEAGRS